MANTFLTRLITERDELSTKLNAIGSFLKTEAFNAIATEEAARLHLQKAIMTQYIEVLELRIKFNQKDAKE
jgi:hypothetical protein